jgi:3-oxoadipate enol-lactonase
MPGEQIWEAAETTHIGEQAIHYVTSGSGDAVLLLHGLTGDHSGWVDACTRLHPRFKVVAVDNRGSGRSSLIRSPVTTEDMARDALGVMDHLGLDHFHVVGRSMGGAIGQHMALLAPDRVASLVLCASFARADWLGMRVFENLRDVVLWRDDWEEYARHAVPFYFSPPFFMEHPEKVAATERLLAAGRDVESYLGQNEACRRHDTFDRLGQIRCPTLVVGGGRDMICSPVTTRELTEGIPNAIGEHFGEAGHFLSLEEPSRFLRMLEEWLGRFCDLTDRGE